MDQATAVLVTALTGITGIANIWIGIPWLFEDRTYDAGWQRILSSLLAAFMVVAGMRSTYFFFETIVLYVS